MIYKALSIIHLILIAENRVRNADAPSAIAEEDEHETMSDSDIQMIYYEHYRPFTNSSPSFRCSDSSIVWTQAGQGYSVCDICDR